MSNQSNVAPAARTIRDEISSHEPLAGLVDILVEVGAEEVLSMPCESGCGEACVEVVQSGSLLVELCADVKEELLHALARQLRVFYYG
jgi:molybdopterin-guanine dinucleotide biosynthesis protein A